MYLAKGQQYFQNAYTNPAERRASILGKHSKIAEDVDDDVDVDDMRGKKIRGAEDEESTVKKNLTFKI